MFSPSARFLRRWLGAGPRTRPTRPRTLGVERLEARDVPATWTALTHGMPTSAGTMMLLSDGTVMIQGGGVTNAWYKLTPDSAGNYVNGTFTQLASMSLQRLYFASNVLPSGKVMVLGGEYSGAAGNQNIANTGEIYDPVANTWSPMASFPQSSFGDDPTSMLPNGNVLAGYIFDGRTYIYNPTTNAWSQTGTKVGNDRSDEETWVKLADGSILSYDIFTSPSTGGGSAERYIPSSGTWVATGPVPVPLTSSALGEELGPGLQIPDGRVFQIGANSNTVLYTPSTNTWATGPVTPNGKGADDAPGAALVNGHIIYAADTPLFNAPTQLFDFDPVANTVTQQTSANTTMPAALTSALNGTPAYVMRMLALPNGHVLFSTGSSQLWDFAPDGAANPAWAPTISSITYNGARTFTLTGTQLNGMTEGAGYGDDAEMSSNYPIVRLTNNSTGAVFYARSFNWSSTGVQTGNTPVTTQFTLPASLPAGTYTLSVSASGIVSTGVAFTPPIYADTHWAGLSNGTAVTDVDPVVAGNQPGIVGTNAFASVNAAIAAAPAGVPVIVNGDNGGTFGKFNESVALNKQVAVFLQQGAVTFGSLSGNTATASIISPVALTVGGDNTSTEFDGVLSGGGSLAKTGTGVLSLAAANTYTGGTTVSGGTLQIGIGGTAGSIAGNVTNNATLAFDRSDNYSFGGTIGGSGTTVNLGSATLTGVISGGQSVNQNSPGQLVLSALNTYTGGVTVTAGSVKLGHSRGLGATTDAVQVNAGASLDLNGLTPFLGSLSLAGTLINSGSGSPPVNLGGTSQFVLQLFSTSVMPFGQTFNLTGFVSGGLKLNADAPIATLSNINLDFGNVAREINVGTGGQWKLVDVPITNGGYNLTGGTLSIQGSSPVTNTAAVTVSGGTLDLAKAPGVNAVGGDVIVNGGSLHLSTGEQILDTANLTVGFFSTFDLDGQTETVASLAGTGGQVSLTGGNSVLALSGSANSTFGGTIAGPGGLVLNGSEHLTLTGTSSYGSTGGTTVNGSSILSVGADANLGDPTALLVLNGGTLQAVGAFATSRPVTLSAAGGFVDPNGNAVTLAGPISGAGGLTQTTAGTLTIGGTGSYLGTTAVNAGILMVNGTVVGPVTVAQGATLAGSGTVGSTSVAGLLSPGNGVGVLHTNSLTFTATGSLTVPINGPGAGTDFSQVVAGGPIDVTNATLVVPIGGSYTPAGATPFDILVNNGGLPITGTFAGLHDGDTFTAGGQNFTISYHGGLSGNDVVLTKVAAAAPPTVANVQINDGSNQRSEVRSISVTFSGPVSFAGGDANAAAAFQLNRIQTGNNVALTAGVSTDAQSRTVVTLTFSGGETDPISALNGGAASLADGRYTLTITGSAITGAGGVALDGAGNGTAGSNYVSLPDTYGGNGPHLYRIYGDANGDGAVDAIDLGQFRSSYNASTGNPLYLAFLDADNSGAVDAQDLGQFRSHYNLNVF